MWLYLRFAATHFRAQMQYPGALALQIVGSALFTAIEFVGLWALLDRFGNVRGWELADVAVLYGLVMVGFSTAEATGRGFDTFHRQVQRGDFDRVLLRPRHTVLQVAGAEFAFHRAGRWLNGAAILAWGLFNAGIAWSPARVILLAETIAGVTVLFLGVFVATAAVTFWTVQSLELLAIVSNGSVDAASYPRHRVPPLHAPLPVLHRADRHRYLLPGGRAARPPRPPRHTRVVRLGRPRRRPPVPGRRSLLLAPRHPPLHLDRKLIPRSTRCTQCCEVTDRTHQ